MRRRAECFHWRVTEGGAEAWNRPRHAERPGYDAWYLTFSDPEQGLGVWLRWTAMSGREPRLEQSALWAFVIHRGRPDRHAGVREVLPRDHRYRDLRAGEIRSELGSAGWELSWESRAAPFGYTGRLLERLLPTGNAMVHPRLAVSGELELNGRSYRFERAAGAQGHTWGNTHARRWNWVHAPLASGWVTGASTPLGSPYAVELDGRRRARTGVAATLARTDPAPDRWRAGGVEVTVDLDDSVAVEYEDPAGGRRVCYHSEFGRLTMGGRLLSTTAAFEYAAPEPLPGRPPIHL